ncbi:MAG: AMP-binding protein [Chloroflexi bacterium]|nr:AMP-binding protein [Chloroflexota bacterium]
MNIGTLLPRHARYRPNHIAVIFEDHRLTYSEFNRRVNRLANALLGQGIQKGDKIATILPNCLELLDVYWAVARIGAVVVPLSPLLREEGLKTLLNDSDTVLLITNRSMAEVIDHIRPELMFVRGYYLIDIPDTPSWHYYQDFVATASEDDPPYIEISDHDQYNIIYSSGTTGMPKGIIHTHYIRSMYCTLFASAYRITPESVILHSGSLVFNGAFLTFMPWMYLGAKYVLLPQFDAEAVIQHIQREGVTHMMMVPSQIIALLNSPDFNAHTMRSVEMIGSVGAPFHRQHKHELNRRLPGVLYELYGLTEGFVTILDKQDVPAKMDSVGSLPAFFEMKIMDEEGLETPIGHVGEIVGRGPILMPGYYKRPDLTFNAIRDGWLYTGDMGYMDEDGFLYLVDRKKDLIISGGVNVYPRDIEEIIVQHPMVREAAVFGVPDDRWGETPLAAVMLREGATTTSEELRDWINERVAARYQKVSEVAIVEFLPRSVAGKTLKRVLRDQYAQSDVKK